VSALRQRVGQFVSHSWRSVVTYLSVLPVALLGALAALGLFLQPLSATAPKVLVNPSVVTASTDPTPSAAVLAELLGQAATMPNYAQRAWPAFAPDAGLLPVDPVGQACAATRPLEPSLSPVLTRSSLLTLLSRSTTPATTPATMVAVSASVVGPGLGLRVFEARQSQASYCSGVYLVSAATTPTPQFIATLSVPSATPVVEFVAVKSDVLVTVVVSAPDGTRTRIVGQTALSYLVDGLATSLAHVCADPQTSATLATRNPTQPDYVAPTRLETLTPPSTFTPPDPTLATARPPTVTVPPVGTVTTAPTAPVIPTVALSATVPVPAPDLPGPGCGWAFTGQVAAALPTSPLSSAAQAAITSLETEWSNWPVTAATYRSALATYNAELISYDHWQSTTTTSTTTTSTTTSTTTVPPTPTSVPPGTTTSHP
jgi:hypothetical protein